MSNTAALYQTYRTRLQRIADIKAANAVLQWDQETYLPPGGASFRGQQISTLSEIAHQFFTDEGLGALLQELLSRDDLGAAERRNVTLTLEDYTKNKRYSSAFVRTMAEQVNKTFHAWLEARKQNSFSTYVTELDALVKLKKEETAILGYSQHPYDALLNEYEKGATVALLDNTFNKLLPPLQSLFQRLVAAPPVNDAFLKQQYPAPAQWDWGLHLLRALQFDFSKGRQDKSEHPFSVSFSPEDVRITTRIDENDFGNMTWSCIHEAGHALYEQGLPSSEYGLPLGEACSYSIHESQSRLWENNVGRGLPFWRFHYPSLQQRFPEQLGTIDLTMFYNGINKVQPSLIRTEADEVSYHFHVYIRYQLEKQLLEGALATADIPAFWNEQYAAYLGVTVPDDKQGALQDVHWSHGSFGYFPTYSLGSFYAAQFFAQAEGELPTLTQELEQGKTENLLLWLRTKIHSRGRWHTSEELCAALTGEGLNGDYFLRYVQEKYAKIYGWAK